MLSPRKSRPLRRRSRIAALQHGRGCGGQGGPKPLQRLRAAMGTQRAGWCRIGEEAGPTSASLGLTPHSASAPPPPSNQNTFGPTEGQNEQWREANRRRQRQTIRYRGLVPTPPPPPRPLSRAVGGYPRRFRGNRRRCEGNRRRFEGIQRRLGRHRRRLGGTDGGWGGNRRRLEGNWRGPAGSPSPFPAPVLDSTAPSYECRLCAAVRQFQDQYHKHPLMGSVVNPDFSCEYSSDLYAERCAQYPQHPSCVLTEYIYRRRRPPRSTDRAEGAQPGPRADSDPGRSSERIINY